MWMSMPDSCLKCTKISVLALPRFLLYRYATVFLLRFLFFIINIPCLGIHTLLPIAEIPHFIFLHFLLF